MYGVAWVLFAGALVIAGLVVAFALTAWAPIFALIALVVAAGVGFAYLAGKRVQIGTERERTRRGEVGRESSRAGAPAEGEGGAGRSGDDERYEPAL
jgi:uncharacterized membrane protein